MCNLRRNVEAETHSQSKEFLGMNKASAILGV